MAWRTRFFSRFPYTASKTDNGENESLSIKEVGSTATAIESRAEGAAGPGTSIITRTSAPQKTSLEPGTQPGRVGQTSGYIVHDIVKSLEVGFGIEASEVEKEALESARAHAEKGLPHHDREGKLEIEEVLSRRSARVLADWARHARSRIEGAIQNESEQIGKLLIALEQRLLRYRYLLDELRASRAGLQQAILADESAAVEAAKAPKRRVSYAALIGSFPFWVFCTVLVLADFVANVPVFNELLPSSPVAATALQNMETNAAGNPVSYGVTTFWSRIVMHLDASILAFSVILFLVILGHFLGRSLRTLTALHRTEAYVDDELIVRHRHLPRLVSWISFAGIAMIVAVLFAARARIEGAARDRLARAESEVATTREQLSQAQQANDPTRVQRLELERQNREAGLPALRDRYEYAVAITALNVPILFLNITLALCAALLGYLHHTESLEVEPLRPSKARAAREHHLARRAAAEAERAEICDLQAEIDTHIKRVHHLMDSRPLLDFKAKTERLRAIIPAFRTENARARGLDSRSIRAFGSVPEIVAEGDWNEPFRLPERFADSLEQNERLRAGFRDLERERQVESEFAE